MNRQQRRRATRGNKQNDGSQQAKKAAGKPQTGSAKQADLESIFQNAVAQHGAGQLDQAIAGYEQILVALPQQPDALHLKGVAMAQMGDLGIGIELLQQAAAAKNDSVDIHNNLGNLLWQAGRLEEADIVLRRAIDILPTHAAAHNNLGGVLEQAGRQEEALASYRAAANLEPNNSAIHGNIGIVLEKLGRLEESAVSLRHAVELDPQSPEAHNNLGNVMKGLGNLEAAATQLRQAIALKPDYANAHQNLGSVLIELRELDEAIATLERAVTLEPDHAQALVNLSAGLNLLERLEESEKFARRAVEIAPDLAEAHNNLGVSIRGQGANEEAEACYRRVVELDPTHATAHSNLIFTLDFNPNYGVADHQAERKRWQELHAAPLATAIQPHDNKPDPHRRLRIGYVSADFRRHSAANGFGPMIMSYDRDAFEIYCYSVNLTSDDWTESFRAAATGWQSCRRLNDSQLAEAIRADKIDILVDLSGHSAGNRLPVFARKPAPVQVTAWGHAAGTGLEAIDYFLSDPVVVPASEAGLYAEEVRYLPSHIPYYPPQPAPEVVDAPSRRNGYITFGSFNRLEKISDGTLAVWSRLLKRSSTACLLIKSQALDRPKVRAGFEERIQAMDIDEDRITLLGSDPQMVHLEKHSLVDIMLDPFPHGGGISTADALWMGVPVIALVGGTIAGRIAASALTAIGLPDLIAKTEDEYIEIAMRLGEDTERLVQLRSSMRQQVAESPVADSKQYVAAVEILYRDFWTRWCATQ